MATADFFAGHGGVSRAARAAGFSAREWELLKGENHDLTRPVVLRKIQYDIKKGLIIAAMLAPPCSSFSPARDRTRVIRSRAFPWGIAGVPPHEVEKLEVGNACILAALKIIKTLDRHGVPWVLENPHSSKMWYLPPLVDFQNSCHTTTIVTDFCQWGTRWRKRTRLLAGNINPIDLERLQKICRGSRGLCSRTGCQHFQLTGSNSHGVPWTRVAQPYPARLCHSLAHSLLAKYMIVPT